MDILGFWAIAGFLLACYSVIGNDSVQTLGTFIASNRKFKWYHQWSYMGAVMVLTILYGWYFNNGDISFGRLDKVPEIKVEWFHIIPPLILLFLTRKGIPASTSFLLLSAFVHSSFLVSVILKSVLGYVLSAICAYLLWLWLTSWDENLKPIKPKNRKYWRVFQWIATGLLWSSWLTHGISNVAIFLPRKLDLEITCIVAVFLVVSLGFLFRNRGGKVQDIVLSKTSTVYVRSATYIDLFYALVLYFFKEYNHVPMSTTWVFVGILTGRELAFSSRMKMNHSIGETFPIVKKDFFKLMAGLIVSVVAAFLIEYLEIFLLAS